MRNIFFVVTFLLLAVTISAQSSMPSISWVRGDTIETLRTKNPNVKFNLTDSFGNIHQFKVDEIENHIVKTSTTFTFDDRGRLSSVILNKQGTSIDVYESLIRKYRSIYGNPVENNELTVRQDLTGATANVRFRNNLGGVDIIFAVPMVNNNPPYIMIIETYKYSSTSSSSSGTTNSQNSTGEVNRTQQRQLALFNGNGSVNYSDLVNFISQLGQAGEMSSNYSRIYTNKKENKEMGKVEYFVDNNGNITRIEFILYFTSENELYEAVNMYANAFGLNNVRVKLNKEKNASKMNWESDMKIKDNIFHSIKISQINANRYLLHNSIAILTFGWQQHYNQFRPILDQRIFD